MKRKLLSVAAVLVTALALPALAQKKYDPGRVRQRDSRSATPTRTAARASAYGAIGKAINAYSAW